MQIIHLTGRVGGDAETRKAGQNDVTNFNLAVDQGWGQNKSTNWFRIAIWGDRGTKLAAYIKKGDKVAVSGELTIGEYNGKPQYEVRCHDVDCFMGGKQDGQRNYGPRHRWGSGAPELDDAVPNFDDDSSVPF